MIPKGNKDPQKAISEFVERMEKLHKCGLCEQTPEIVVVRVEKDGETGFWYVPEETSHVSEREGYYVKAPDWILVACRKIKERFDVDRETIARGMLCPSCYALTGLEGMSILSEGEPK